MRSDELIIGLVGPSGVGKGFAKQALVGKYGSIFHEPTVATTRPKRSSDGADRRAGLSKVEFGLMVATGKVAFAHQPFKNGDWYGFMSDSLIVSDKPTLTEVHVDNIQPFRQHFADSLLLIGIVATESYLRQNLAKRGSETEEQAEERLRAAITEIY